MHISDELINSIQKQLASFGHLSGCGGMLLDCDGEPTVLVNAGSCALCGPAAHAENCVTCHRHASYQAERFGGKYIYFCPSGFIFCTSVFALGNKKVQLTAGPIMATDHENFVMADLNEPFSAKDKPEEEDFSRFADSLNVIPPEKITAISDMLAVLAENLSEAGIVNESSKNHRILQKEEQQQQINEYIQSIKARLMLGVDSFQPYPYDKEKQLIYAITTGDLPDARRYLNEILGYVFFASANDLDAIKIRAMELTVLISRAAIDGGADVSAVDQTNSRFISDFFQLSTIEDVCYALSDILRKFTEETFKSEGVKHVDLISKAVSYIRSNYMHKITLEDVADHIYLSPSYLSRIFKEEMNTSFNSYLNSVRIEKSKILLLSDQLSICEIAELVGFFDQSYFNKVFKKYTGYTPKRYREQKREL